MLTNMEMADDLQGLMRAKAREFVTKTVKPDSAEQFVSTGWQVTRKTRKSVSLRKPKESRLVLENRVWTLLYRTGFEYLSVDGGAELDVHGNGHTSTKVHLPVVGIDADVATVCVPLFCDQSEMARRFTETVELLKTIQLPFITAVNQQYSNASQKRHSALAIFVPNDSLTQESKRQASAAKISVLEERDLSYYTELTAHLGKAAKYQLLADLLPGKQIPGLKIRVPAIKMRMGPYTCYNFCLQPEYLLKIAFVSHRSRGTDSDLLQYQRMIKKARLKAIRAFLNEDDAIFPTNIVITIDRNKLHFERQQQDTDQQNGVMGWLAIKASYKSAWVIDGQHRLFAYSGHPKAVDSRLIILAFESLPSEKQAGLFIDINAEQKSVKPSILQSLYEAFNWTAEKEKDRVSAVVSRAIRLLNSEPDSPLHQRIQSSDEKTDDVRCISIQSIFDALAKRPDLFAGTSKADSNDYNGPLWVDGNLDATLDRTLYVLDAWFNAIRNAAPDWWDAGKTKGTGGLAMNDSVAALIAVLRSVIMHAVTEDPTLRLKSNSELVQTIQPYLDATAEFISSLSDDERANYRRLRGVQGQTARMRECQRAINRRIPGFCPDGLEKYIEEQRTQTNTKAKVITDRIELALKKAVIEELKREYGPEEGQWWMEGVSKGIRQKVSSAYEDDAGARGSREAYFDLLDYRRVVQDHWSLFMDLLGEGKPNASKDKRTSWINDVNECRKIVAHPSSGKIVSLSELARLEEIDAWLQAKLAGRLDTEEE